MGGAKNFNEILICVINLRCYQCLESARFRFLWRKATLLQIGPASYIPADLSGDNLKHSSWIPQLWM